ncbi:hypothetical protein [Actinoplanes sp. NPDC049681]|uniref:hypothetical protein n=1 Tax=Actinoplanes sp. NPDC049681 TaxID=3363905 RepID=UPI0037AE99C3
MVLLLWLSLILSFVALWHVRRAMAPIGVLVRGVMSALVATLTLFGLIGLLVWLLAVSALRN